jgi:glycine oxidase
MRLLDADVMVVGDGLAGAVLTWLLRADGAVVRLFPGNPGQAASRVAAGVLNPVTGKRLAAGWEVEAQLSSAFSVYGQMEAALGISVLRRVPLHRFFLHPSEEVFHAKRLEDARYRAFLSDARTAGEPLGGFIQARGYFTISGAGHLEIPPLLDALSQVHARADCVEPAPFAYERLDRKGPGLVYDGRIRARAVVFCEGIGVLQNPWFGSLRFRPVKGEALTFTSPELKLPEAVFHHEKWLLPTSNGRFRMGSTYDRGISLGEGHRKLRADAFSPSTDGEAELRGSLPKMFQVPPSMQIVEHKAGVRPATRDRFPYAGPHPEDARLLVFNGLGSKGALLAPWIATRLVRYLRNGEPLPEPLRPERFGLTPL